MDDVPWLIEQVSEFIEFTGYQELFDPEFLPALVTGCVAQHFVIVAYNSESGERMGMLAAHLNAHPFNPRKKLLAELCWWVPRNFRHTRAGIALLVTYTEWGKKNADIVTVCTMDNSPLNQGSLEKRGFKFKEKTYVWGSE